MYVKRVDTLTRCLPFDRSFLSVELTTEDDGNNSSSSLVSMLVFACIGMLTTTVQAGSRGSEWSASVRDTCF